MIKKFFQKFGVYLSKTQTRIIKFLLMLAVLWAFVGALLLIFGENIFGCKTTSDQVGIFRDLTINCTQENNFNTSDPVVLLPLAVIGTIAVLIALPMIGTIIWYVIKLLFNKTFRESEMTASVNFLERDEREQFMTMRATRRAYMVLNFALLVAWLYNLVIGNLGAVLWFFVIQILGALSFRSQIEPKKPKKT